MAPTSTFTIRDLVDTLKHLDVRQTALLRGPHGIGKSAVVYQMAKIWGFDTVIERRISQLSEGDILGLPDRGAVKSVDKGALNGISKNTMKEFDEEQGGWHVTKFLPTDWFLEASIKPCLVFLDEINRGTCETMQACFQFIENGQLNGREIHPDSRIIAAVNDSKDYQVTQMDPAFVDRFWVADVSPDKKDWLIWARGEGNINSDIIDFVIQCNTDHFEIQPEKLSELDASEITPSRRSWEKVNKHLNNENNGSKLIDHPELPAFYNICRGFVGPDAARALHEFIKTRSAHVSLNDIMNKFSSVKEIVKKLKPERQLSLVDKISHHIKSNNVKLTQKQGKNLAMFQETLPEEIGINMWNILASTSVHNATVFHKYVAKYFIDIKNHSTTEDTEKK